VAPRCSAMTDRRAIPDMLKWVHRCVLVALVLLFAGGIVLGFAGVDDRWCEFSSSNAPRSYGILLGDQGVEFKILWWSNSGAPMRLQTGEYIGVRYCRGDMPIAPTPTSGLRGKWRPTARGRKNTSSMASLSFSYGFITVAASLYPIYFAVRVFRRRWTRGGACVDCHYDLTGNLSGRCPECGATVEVAA